MLSHLYKKIEFSNKACIISIKIRELYQSSCRSILVGPLWQRTLKKNTHLIFFLQSAYFSNVRCTYTDHQKHTKQETRECAWRNFSEVKNAIKWLSCLIFRTTFIVFQGEENSTKYSTTSVLYPSKLNRITGKNTKVDWLIMLLNHEIDKLDPNSVEN